MTIETEFSGKPQEIKRCDKCQDHHAGRPALRLGWPGERKSIGATSRSKYRFSKSPGEHLAQRNQLQGYEGASTSRARAKVWAQLPGAQGLWGVQGLGPGSTGAWGPEFQKAWGPGPSGWGLDPTEPLATSFSLF